VDSSTVYYTSNAGSEFARLRSYDIEAGRHATVAQADWDIMFSSLSWKGTYRVQGVNADARTEISIRRTATMEPLALPAFPRGDVAGVSISRSENMMAFYVNGDTAPSNLYVMELPTGTPRRLTNSLSRKIDQDHLVESTVVRYPSFAGLEIPALLYKPTQASAGNPVPALVFVHGGPGGQSRTGYRAEIQYLVNHGYAVLAVNNRGSSGYGKTFFHLDDRNHGEGDLQDCVFGRKYLETLDWVDGEKIGIMGGSYGGYMVAAALAFTPDAFDVGVDIFGVTNWLRTLKSIPPWWADFKEALYAEMGDPATDEARLRRISPLFHADKIRKPLLVVQGANDPRVLQVESDELVEAARNNGVPVEYVVFPDEGHGFRRKENRITAAKAYRDFLDRYLAN
jgi:dipeptidyl aminopeptidase/acylaminoacyl peptidase